MLAEWGWRRFNRSTLLEIASTDSPEVGDFDEFRHESAVKSIGFWRKQPISDCFCTITFVGKLTPAVSTNSDESELFSYSAQIP